MSKGGLLLIGGGGHAIVVAEAALAMGLEVVGFLDDDSAASLGELAPRLGGLRLMDKPELVELHPMILAVGGIATRRDILANLKGVVVNVVHPSAVVAPSAKVGPGAFIGPRAVVHSRAVVGPHAIINTAAVVEHDCVIGENTHIAPGVVLGGDVHVGDDTLVGISACATPGVKIGARCTIGAGAAVVWSVDDGLLMKGVPAQSYKGSV